MKGNLKRFFGLSILLIVSITLLTGCLSNKKADERGYIVKVGDQVPDFDIKMADGTTIPIKSLRGKYVMLQFTASWCGVCRQEMPYIEKDIWQKYGNNPNFKLFGIDLKESAQKCDEFAKQTMVTYPITLDEDGKIFELFCAPDAGVTRNIIINPKGEIVMLTRLFDMEEFQTMVNFIDSSLKKYNPAVMGISKTKKD